jgi:hypothetical protein
MNALDEEKKGKPHRGVRVRRQPFRRVDPEPADYAREKESQERRYHSRQPLMRAAWLEQFAVKAGKLLASPGMANRFPHYLNDDEDRRLMAVYCSTELTSWRWAVAYQKILPGGDPFSVQPKYPIDKMSHRKELEAAYNALKQAWRQARTARLGFIAAHGSTNNTDTAQGATNGQP